jgi:hypothetical protein
MQQAELVALGVGQHGEALVTALSDVGRVAPRASRRAISLSTSPSRATRSGWSRFLPYELYDRPAGR